MTAIWQNDESGWHLLSPTGFANEEKLHELVEKASHSLPLWLVLLDRLYLVERCSLAMAMLI